MKSWDLIQLDISLWFIYKCLLIAIMFSVHTDWCHRQSGFHFSKNCMVRGIQRIWIWNSKSIKYMLWFLRSLPIHSQDIISKSPFWLPYNSYVISSENLVLDQLIILIKTMTKFLNVTGHHPLNLSTNKTEYASCL